MGIKNGRSSKNVCRLEIVGSRWIWMPKISGRWKCPYQGPVVFIALGGGSLSSVLLCMNGSIWVHGSQLSIKSHLFVVDVVVFLVSGT